MRRKLPIVIFGFTIILVFLVSINAHALSASDVELTAINQLRLDGWFAGALGENRYWLIQRGGGNISIIEISLKDGSVKSNFTIGSIYGYVMDAVYFNGYLYMITSYYNSTIGIEEYFAYRFPVDTWDGEFKKLTLPDFQGYLWSMVAYKDKILVTAIDYNRTSMLLLDLNYDKATLTLTNINFTSPRDIHYFHLVYFGGEFLAVSYSLGEIFDSNNNTIVNATEDFQNKKGVKVEFMEMMDADNTPDGGYLALLTYTTYNTTSASSFQSKAIYDGIFLMLYKIKGVSVGIGGIKSPTEPVTASGVSIAVASAATASVAVAATITTTSVASTTAPSTTATAVSGQPGAPSAIVPQGAAIFEQSRGIWRYLLRASRYLARLVRRKKKDKEKFSRPSYLKMMVLLIVFSSIISILLSIGAPWIFSSASAIISLLMAGIGVSLGFFGLLIGLFLVYALRKNILPPAAFTTKLSIYASLIGGIYGFIVSSYKLFALLGFISIVGVPLLSVISSLFSITAYGYTLQIYE